MAVPAIIAILDLSASNALLHVSGLGHHAVQADVSGICMPADSRDIGAANALCTQAIYVE